MLSGREVYAQVPQNETQRYLYYDVTSYSWVFSSNLGTASSLVYTKEDNATSPTDVSGQAWIPYLIGAPLPVVYLSVECACDGECR